MRSRVVRGAAAHLGRYLRCSSSTMRTDIAFLLLGSSDVRPAAVARPSSRLDFHRVPETPLGNGSALRPRLASPMRATPWNTRTGSLSADDDLSVAADLRVEPDGIPRVRNRQHGRDLEMEAEGVVGRAGVLHPDIRQAGFVLFQGGANRLLHELDRIRERMDQVHDVGD